MNELISLSAAAELIRQGRRLSVAGNEHTLDQLPAGAWIGGTIPYFMLSEGGTEVQDARVFVSDLGALGEVQIDCVGPTELTRILDEAPDNGFTQLIIPAGGQTLQRFAESAADSPEAFLKPTVGWVAGVHLSQIGQQRPWVYDGRTGHKHSDHAVLARVTLPPHQLVQVDIVNLFEPDGTDTLRFEHSGFTVDTCLVNGEPANLADYLQARGLCEGRQPLVGDYAGAHVNVSIQRVDAQARQVHLFAPVFAGVDYQLAEPVPDQGQAFRERIATSAQDGAVLSCNCVLNYLFGGLQGQAIGGTPGPFTFGEIAYQLLDQTQVTVRIV